MIIHCLGRSPTGCHYLNHLKLNHNPIQGMKLVNQRNFYTTGNPKGDYTLGICQADFAPFKCFVLEDTFRPTKVPGETRFKSGLYKLGIRKEDTPLTIKHRESYAAKQKADPKTHGDWFLNNPGWFHIEILDIPDYIGCYWHSGIDDSHTKGCNLPMYGFDLSKIDNPGSFSLKATNDLYALVYPLLIEGKTIFQEVRDEI